MGETPRWAVSRVERVPLARLAFLQLPQVRVFVSTVSAGERRIPIAARRLILCKTVVSS